MLPEPLAVTVKVTGVLEKLGIPYLIGGSLASTIYGMVRTTQDVDIIAEMRLDHIYTDEEMIAESIRHNSSFNIIHRETMFKVDVFIPRRRPFHQSQFARAQKQVIAVEPEVSAYFSSAEDTILAKLEWYRMGGEVSERQWRDVLGILKMRTGALDLDYLRKWAKELKVIDLLEQALKESI
jgi:hypothetical protein